MWNFKRIAAIDFEPESSPTLKKLRARKTRLKVSKIFTQQNEFFFYILTQNHRCQLHKAKGFQLWCLEHRCCQKLKNQQKNSTRLSVETYKLMKSFWWDLQLHISVSFTPIDFKSSHNNLNMFYINIRKFKKMKKYLTSSSLNFTIGWECTYM